MFKKIKYSLFIIFIIFFLYLVVSYYFSDTNKKKSYRSLNNIDNRLKIYAKKLPILENDTKNIIEYVEQSKSKSKKKFNFWKLIEINE
tara:strand:+ start:89 stop:352 length:264 start_codon:yes stop_codon:yes gene_type:complete